MIHQDKIAQFVESPHQLDLNSSWEHLHLQHKWLNENNLVHVVSEDLVRHDVITSFRNSNTMDVAFHECQWGRKLCLSCSVLVVTSEMKERD